MGVLLGQVTRLEHLSHGGTLVGKDCMGRKLFLGPMTMASWCPVLHCSHLLTPCSLTPCKQRLRNRHYPKCTIEMCSLPFLGILN